jgi:CheY-like chemotaxis protein
LEVAAHQVERISREVGAALALTPALTTLSECLANATEGNERVRVIVRDLMTFSRARAESRVLLDVEIVLDSAVNLAWNEIRHRARLVKRYARTPPVMADEARLGQVFLNLLLNAAQAIPEGRASQHEIRLITRQRGEQVIVDVEDTGAGIAPEHFGRIFEPFFSTKPAAGTGLGLSICHGIVQALGGEIVVGSLPHGGTRFSVSLPAAGESELVQAVTQAPPSSTPLHSRLLIVDDEPLLTQTLRVALADHEVVVVSAGQSALDVIARDDGFDLVLCDLMMPELSGARVYEEIREQKPELARRFVFMTGGAFTDGARQFLDRFDGVCLEKPFAVERISTLLEQMRRR